MLPTSAAVRPSLTASVLAPSPVLPTSAVAVAAPSDAELGSVEELLIEFLGRNSIDAAEPFDALCAAHPSKANALRELHAQWAMLDRVLGQREDAAPLDAPQLESPNAASPNAASPNAASPNAALPNSGQSGGPPPRPELLDRLSTQSAPSRRYEIECELAHGGMGVVYRAWDRDLRRVVAMKVLRDERLRVDRADPRLRDRALARFIDEAQITGQLDHPGIVPVHEIGLDAEGRVFFIMPLVRGRELGRLFALAREQREGWSLPRLLAVFVRVCEAVAYAHSKGVVHRDLKPSNVMVGAFGETYVMDWGLARVLDDVRAESERAERALLDAAARPPASSAASSFSAATSAARGELAAPEPRARSERPGGSAYATRQGAVIGTPAYMAPEQAAGQLDRIGPRSDVYAIGAMLYQLLAGTMPYADSTARLTPEALIAARLARAPTPIAQLAPSTPRELIAICAKAMAAAPEQRYASALELAEDLQAFLGQRAVRALDAGPVYLARLALRRNARLAVACGVGLLATLALLARDSWKSRVSARELAQRANALLDLNDQLGQRVDLAQAQALLAEEDRLELREERDLERLRAWSASAASVLERAERRQGSGAEVADFAALSLWSSRTPPSRASASSASSSRGEPPSTTSPSTSQLAPYAALASAAARVAERVRRVEARAREDAEAWETACASIAASERYGGLRLAPQWGLAPLQLNPTSGLWEFWVVESGERPRVADASTGRLEPDPASALVLVLVPGGTARLGSASNDLGRNLLFPPRDDGGDRTDNEDERWLELEPFFIGKSEVPQGVWQRVMGANPAHFFDDEMCKYEPWTSLLPVECVRWSDAREFTGKLGLTLPTEAQWEYSARCGRVEPLAFGASDDLASLAGLENLNDQLGGKQAPAHVGLLSSPWCDGFWSMAPVMSLGANTWGLHDMLGNVSEACEDVYSELPFGGDLAGPGGAAPLAEGRLRVFRGASYFTPRAEAVRVAFRQFDRPSGTNHGRGLRVARPVR